MLGEFADLGLVEVHDGCDVCCNVTPLRKVTHHRLGLVTAAANDSVELVCVIVEVDHSGSGFDVALAEFVCGVEDGYGFVDAFQGRCDVTDLRL